MTQTKDKSRASTKSNHSTILKIACDLTRRTGSLNSLEDIFAETISCLKSNLKTNDVLIYTFAIKNQKLEFEYQKIGKTGQLKKSCCTHLPNHADLIRTAYAKKKIIMLQHNPDQQDFIPSQVDPLLQVVIPFKYRDKIFGCIHICNLDLRYNSEAFMLFGELVAMHLQSICAKAIELDYLNKFKARVRRLINAKVNELEEALDRAAKYNQSLKDFSYIVSHDLREPLRTINSYIKLLERRYKDHFDGDAKDFMFFVTDGVARMDALIQDLLVFSRVEHSIYQFEEIEMDKILTLVKNSLRLKIAETKAEIEYFNPPTIIASKSHIHILMQNLLDNAIKFRKEGQVPKVQVVARDLQQYWQFSIADNGIGINLEHKNNERIFKIFQRLHGVDSHIPGTGIGLAICKNIVNAHGGKIWVSSNGNDGSTFHFTIAKDLAKD